jgi:hypothetical protein
VEGGDSEARKRIADAALESLFTKRARMDTTADEEPRSGVPEFKRPVAATVAVDTSKVSEDLPAGWIRTKNPAGQYYYLNVETKQTLWERPTEEIASRMAAEWQQRNSAATLDVNEIIERAKREAEQAEKEADAAGPNGTGGEEKEAERKKKKERAKDKQLASLFGQIVVTVMSKHKAHFDSDTFKRRAKEVGLFFFFSVLKGYMTDSNRLDRQRSCWSTRRRSRQTIQRRSIRHSLRRRRPKLEALSRSSSPSSLPAKASKPLLRVPLGAIRLPPRLRSRRLPHWLLRMV